MGVPGLQWFDRGGAVLTVLEGNAFDAMYLVGSPVDMDALTFIRALRSSKFPNAAPIFLVMRPTATLLNEERNFLKYYGVTVLKASLEDQKLFMGPLRAVFADRSNAASVLARLEGAKRLLKEGLQSWAAKVYEEVLEEESHNLTARVGLMRASTANPEVYWRQLQHLLEQDPKNYFFRFELVDRFMQEGRPHDAEHAVAKVMAQISEEGDLFWLVELGVISVTQRIFGFCMKIAEMIRQRASRDQLWQADLLLARMYLAGGSLEEAEKFLRIAVSLAPGEKAEIENTKAILARKRGAYREAIERYRHALRLAPEDHRIAFNIGLCHELGGEVDLALAAFRSALVLSPSYQRAKAKVEELEGRRAAT